MSMGEEPGKQWEEELWLEGIVGGELEYNEAAVAINIALDES